VVQWQGSRQEVSTFLVAAAALHDTEPSSSTAPVLSVIARYCVTSKTLHCVSDDVAGPHTSLNSIQGITKPAIRRLARRGGVKRISGLIYEVGVWSSPFEFMLTTTVNRRPAASSSSSSRTLCATASPTLSTRSVRQSPPSMYVCPLVPGLVRLADVVHARSSMRSSALAVPSTASVPEKEYCRSALKHCMNVVYNRMSH